MCVREKEKRKEHKNKSKLGNTPTCSHTQYVLFPSTWCVHQPPLSHPHALTHSHTHTKQRETTLWVRFRVTADLWIADSLFHRSFSNMLSGRLNSLGRHTGLGRRRKADLSASWAVVFHNVPTHKSRRKQDSVTDCLWVSFFHMKLTAEWQLNWGRKEKRGRI